MNLQEIFNGYLGSDIPHTGNIISHTNSERPKRKRVSKVVEETELNESESDDRVAHKRARRKQQNRLAAQTSREKKKRYLQELEERVRLLQEQNAKLAESVTVLQAENQRLLTSGTPEPTTIDQQPISSPHNTDVVQSQDQKSVILESAVPLPQQPEMTDSTLDQQRLPIHLIGNLFLTMMMISSVTYTSALNLTFSNLVPLVTGVSSGRILSQLKQNRNQRRQSTFLKRDQQQTFPMTSCFVPQLGSKTLLQRKTLDFSYNPPLQIVPVYHEINQTSGVLDVNSLYVLR